MPKCPKCGKEIDHLRAVETVEVDLIATYDEENEELELETADAEYWHGNPIGEQVSLVFSCPQCERDLFYSEEAAKDFLAGKL